MGCSVKALPVAAGLTQRALANTAELSVSMIGRIEAGTRRTRRSTLERIAAAFDQPELGEELARLAGPALAPESAYAGRIATRRQRRTEKARRRQAHAEAERQRAE